MPTPYLESGGLFKAYAAGFANTDLSIDYPGYTTARGQKFPRWILYAAGILVVTPKGGLANVTLPASMAGIPIPIRPNHLVNAGSTAAVLVVW